MGMAQGLLQLGRTHGSVPITPAVFPAKPLHQSKRSTFPGEALHQVRRDVVTSAHACHVRGHHHHGHAVQRACAIRYLDLRSPLAGHATLHLGCADDGPAGDLMSYSFYALELTTALFLAMFALLWMGLRIGQRHLRDEQQSDAGTGPVNAAIFGLLGLMVAFTFSGAGMRFDERRALIVEEANNIGTAWLRIDLLPPASQPVMRDLFRAYTDARLHAYRSLPDEDAYQAEIDRADQLQSDIWFSAVEGSQAPGAAASAPMLLLPALNAMFDITTTRHMALFKHPPPAVYVVLCMLALLSAVLAGHAMAGRQKPSLLHLVAYPLIIAVVVNLVINMEHPRIGLIRVDGFDIAIEAVRAEMN